MFPLLTNLYVFEVKHISLDKCVLYFLVSPCHKELVVMIGLEDIDQKVSKITVLYLHIYCFECVHISAFKNELLASIFK